MLIYNYFIIIKYMCIWHFVCTNVVVLVIIERPWINSLKRYLMHVATTILPAQRF